jgi:hypothetical protein
MNDFSGQFTGNDQAITELVATLKNKINSKKQSPNQMKDALRYLEMAITPPEGCFINIHHKGWLDNGKVTFPGTAHQDYQSAADSAFYWAERRGVKGCHDVYLSQSPMLTAGPKRERNPYLSAIRKEWNAAGSRCSFMDIDVRTAEDIKTAEDKANSYPSTEEAVDGFGEFLRKSKLKLPTMIVSSGTGGFHVYWRFPELMPPELFKQRAKTLVMIAQRHGLKFDRQCTSDIVRLLRIPSTWNFKTDPASPVTIAWENQDV